MSSRSEAITATPELLRGWGLPEPDGDKNSRGRIVVVGGSEATPGAVLLAGIAALRVGAGRLSIVAPQSIGVPLGVAAPEAGVHTLDRRGRLTDDAEAEIASADAVLVGPGIGDPQTAKRMLRAVSRTRKPATPLILDAFAVGVLPDLGRHRPRGAVVVNPNLTETARLLGRDIRDLHTDVAKVAHRYQAVVSSHACVGAPDGRVWRIADAGPVLGTSGSGDVLAGAITGFAARGVDLAEAAVWAAFVHALAGTRLAERLGATGALARELRDELPSAIRQVLRAGE